MLIDIFYDILQKAYRNGISIVVTEDDIIKDGVSCCGYFDFTELKLAISTAYKRSDFLYAFIHESCHMDQWLEKSRAILDAEDPLVAAGIIQNAELDCEIRTVNKLKEWGYKTPRNYVKKANSYILAYQWMANERRWIDFDYEDKRIMEMMPSKFMPLEWYTEPDRKIIDVFNLVGSLDK
jgi:hypothetical protein